MVIEKRSFALHISSFSSRKQDRSAPDAAIHSPLEPEQLEIEISPRTELSEDRFTRECQVQVKEMPNKNCFEDFFF